MATSGRHSYVNLYPSDWLAGCAFMPPLAEWVYLQVCLYNWDKCAPMPEPDQVLRFSRHANWKDDLKLLLDAGKVIKTHNGGLFVQRAMAEAQRSMELWEKKSRGGRGKKSSGKQQHPKHSNNTHSNTHQTNENENENVISPYGENTRAGDLIFAPPQDAWEAFKEHRKEIGNPLTERAERIILKKLETWQREFGHDPTAVLEQSIANGWTGVFEPKGNTNGQGAGANKAKGSGLLDACIEASAGSDKRNRSDG